ncbi:MAG TPA: PIN domain-containing protein [Candidatus Binataceae bacterium]|nr:PIN domain-containing protein [Candidatus Binataceae bacterium]
MNAYVDSSVLLRKALGQPRALKEQINRPVSSVLIVAESLRTLDRLRLRDHLSVPEVATRRQAIISAVASLELIELDTDVLGRVAQPMPTELGTLDAIHLTSALLWQEATGENLTMATHDRALALAAQAYGMNVVGVALT